MPACCFTLDSACAANMLQMPPQVSRLVCDKSLTLGEVVGLSIAVSAVGLALLAYCLYVAWSGRWGLPKLQRVRRQGGVAAAGNSEPELASQPQHAALKSLQLAWSVVVSC